MTETNPIILDPSEPLQEEQAKALSEQANSSDSTTNAVESFTKPPKRSTKGQIQAKYWFLTYPQTTTTKEEAQQQLLNNPKLRQMGIKGFLIAQEKHKDNNSHLHIALWLNKKMSVLPKFFDFVCK